MYIDIEKVEVTKTPEGEVKEATDKYEKVFLAKVCAFVRMHTCIHA